MPPIPLAGLLRSPRGGHARPSRALAAARLLAAIALCAGSLTPRLAPAQEPTDPEPSFAQLEAAGARVGTIRVVTHDIFDTDDPREDKWLFRVANKLHIQTRAEVIERALLFKSGDLVSVRTIEETERLLRSNRYLYDVRIKPMAVHDDVVDIEVSTRDTWSLDPGLSAGRQGGANSTSFGLREYNLLGTGITLGIGRSSNVDRSSTTWSLSNSQLFGTRALLDYSHATSDDGRRDAIQLARPFYALDARRAAGLEAFDDNRIDPIYNAGRIASQYRHRQRSAEVFGGLSPGLVDGWTQRYSFGLSLKDDRYAIEPGLAAPAQLPDDNRLVGPFVRFELIEDRYDRELNRNLIGRPEFFALGLASRVQLGYASRGFGSTQDTVLFSGSISRGFQPAADHTLTASAKVSGQYAGGQSQRVVAGTQVQYYWPHAPRWLFFAGGSADAVKRGTPEDLLQLGGDSGLRGYPLRYQAGTRRALLTVEERFYTDIYLWRLFRIGGAAFFDHGRAWGGADVNVDKPGWLSNAGFGLRIVSARSAFSNVLHVDLAFPLNATADIRKTQFLVKTKTSF